MHKLDKDEWQKTCEWLWNYVSIVRKFLDQNPKTGWAKSARFLEQLYAESDHLMLITLLCLHSLTVTDSLLLHVLQQLAAEQRRQAKHGGKKLNLTKIYPNCILYLNHVLQLTSFLFFTIARLQGSH